MKYTIHLLLQAIFCFGFLQLPLAADEWKLVEVKEGVEVFEETYREIAGFSVSDSRPIENAKHVKVPTFVIQVKDDAMTYPADVQAIYDAIPVEDKKLSGSKVLHGDFTGIRISPISPSR